MVRGIKVEHDFQRKKLRVTRSRKRYSTKVNDQKDGFKGTKPTRIRLRRFKKSIVEFKRSLYTKNWCVIFLRE